MTAPSSNDVTPELPLPLERRSLGILVGAQTLAAGLLLPVVAFGINRGLAERPWSFGGWPVYLVLVAALVALAASFWGRARYQRGQSRQQRTSSTILAAALAETAGVLGFTVSFLGLDGTLLALVLGAVASLVAGGILVATVVTAGRARHPSGPITLGR